MNKEEELIKLLNKIDISIWGISDISDLDVFNGRFNRAISIGQGYSYKLNTYSPTGFYDFLINGIKENIEENISIIEDFLKKENIDYHVVTNNVPDRNKCYGEFSDKFAAVRAGLGWIGKNALLITPEYGPHIRLSTILVNLDLPVSKKKKEYAGCGECNKCVKICPAKCFKNVNWQKGMKREELVDIMKCKERTEKRKGYMCALCLIACPVGEKI